MDGTQKKHIRDRLKRATIEITNNLRDSQRREAPSEEEREIRKEIERMGKEIERMEKEMGKEIERMEKEIERMENALSPVRKARRVRYEKERDDLKKRLQRLEGEALFGDGAAAFAIVEALEKEAEDGAVPEEDEE